MKNRYRELQEDVQDEAKAIDETLERLSVVRNQFSVQDKNYTTEPAMGTYLMNFYNGIENIIKRISKGYYLTMPKGENWHKELLLLSVKPPQDKIPLFSQNIVEKLNPYRNFRHRFVSGYGFQLKAEKMLELVDNIVPLWSEVKMEISDFWKKIILQEKKNL